MNVVGWGARSYHLFSYPEVLNPLLAGSSILFFRLRISHKVVREIVLYIVYFVDSLSLLFSLLLY